MIRRRGEPSHEDSSSDEEDAFSALSKKEKIKRDEKAAALAASIDSVKKNMHNGPTSTSQSKPVQLPVSTTSSMKRHHGILSDTRKSKMDALLQELEAEKEQSNFRKEPSFVPDKKGSFVEPWEEHLTTNIFVGNLAPSLTEEAVTDFFRQFGDLYSVKIMWPRTPEERSRNRNTGFVCFMNREDAEEAMDACDDADPFNVGRRLMLRWGKNVKKIVKHGTGGAAPIQKRARSADDNYSLLPTKRRRAESETSSHRSKVGQSQSSDDSLRVPVYDPEFHGKDAIRVQVPRDPKRLRLITTVASFIAKDGAYLEQKLAERESGNPDFAFLSMNEHASEQQQEEHIYYRWRVYAFCQGDGMNTWRTKPFVMVHPGGRFWIPPSIDRQAAMQEEEEQRNREESIRRQKQQRRRYGGKRDAIMTGRQIEQRRAAARAADGGAALTDKELHQFNVLVRQKLCASRTAICEAMAFCFEKSAAAKHISSLLKQVLTESRSDVSIESRIARLYLLSDVLFNSQQPGVRNAFLYRDAVERMAPEVFTSLGKLRDGNVGRLTMNKLSTAVSSVLGAWTNWSVYNPTFMDELHARYEGREIVSEKVPETSPEEENKDDDQKDKEEDRVMINMPRGDWLEVTDEPNADEGETEKLTSRDDSVNLEVNATSHDKTLSKSSELISSNTGPKHSNDVDGKPVEDVDGELMEQEVDGEPCDGDVDGEPVDDVHNEPGDDDVDGEPVDDVDGEPIEDVDGEPIDDVDGEPVDDVDGEPVNVVGGNHPDDIVGAPTNG